MAYAKYSFARGHVWVAVVAAIVALGCGVAIGYLYTRPAQSGPSMQAMIDFLSKPLPVPKGARRLPMTELAGHGGGGEWIYCNKQILLDVTGMSLKDVQAIPAMYESHFRSELPFGGGGSSGPGNYGLVRLGPDQFTMCAGIGTYRRIEKLHGASGRVDLDLTIDSQAMDFDPSLHGDRPFEVNESEFNRPVRGQRVMWIICSFKGSGLTGPGIWPK